MVFYLKDFLSLGSFKEWTFLIEEGVKVRLLDHDLLIVRVGCVDFMRYLDA